MDTPRTATLSEEMRRTHLDSPTFGHLPVNSPEGCPSLDDSISLMRGKSFFKRQKLESSTRMRSSSASDRQQSDESAIFLSPAFSTERPLSASLMFKRWTVDGSVTPSHGEPPVLTPLTLGEDGFADEITNQYREEETSSEEETDEYTKSLPVKSQSRRFHKLPERMNSPLTLTLSRCSSMPTISSPERLEQILAARARVKPAIPIKPKLLEKSESVTPRMPSAQHLSRVLPTVPKEHHMDPMLRLITPQTLSDVVAGKFSDKLSRYIIVDCRFPFEYEGGHVAGAYNLWTLENVVAAFFMQQIIPLKEAHRCAVIFHCEFSSHRAPTQYINLRTVEHELTSGGFLFPEVYLVEGGYEAIFKAMPHHCTPSDYVLMKDPRFTQIMDQNEQILERSRLVAKQGSWKDDAFDRMRSLYRASGLDGLVAHLAALASPTRSTVQGSPRTPATQTTKDIKHRRSLGKADHSTAI